MKQFPLFFAICLGALHVVAGQQSELIALEPHIGNYPSQVDLLKKPVLGKRLKDLMGGAAYRNMIKNWEVDWRLENEKGVLHTSGRPEGEPGEPAYHLFIDLPNDNINIVRFVDQKRTDFQEKGKIALSDGQKEAFRKDASRHMAPRPANPDGAHTQSTEGYTTSTADERTAEKIRGFIRNSQSFAGDLSAAAADDRRFRYDTYDLNADGKLEYLVGFETPYFCGTGGCTYLLFGPGGRVINRFTASRAPFYVLSSASNGWYELAVDSGGAIRKLISDGQAYPSNPSTGPIYIGKTGEKAHLLLGMDRPVAKF